MNIQASSILNKSDIYSSLRIRSINVLEYDKTDRTSIVNHGKRLKGKTFYDVLNQAEIDDESKQKIITTTNNPNYKGGMGHLIEEHHFNYKINNDKKPDFPEAGIELKVTPYEIGKRGGYSAGERLAITKINYNEPVVEDFYNSHIYTKLHSTLLVQYLRDCKKQRMDYKIDFVTLFTPPPEDLKIIQQDYEKIITKIKNGEAHKLSEKDTMYLGTFTKGKNSSTNFKPQNYYAPNVMAQGRAFCFRKPYMKYVLNNHVRGKEDNGEAILNSVTELRDKTFEELIVEKINSHRGKTDVQLAAEFGVKKKTNSFWSSISYRMLGVKSHKVKEFMKANIELKAIRIETKKKKNTKEEYYMREDISFPPINFKKFANEVWEDSDFHNDLISKRYLFVIYKKKGNNYVLNGCQLWSMTEKDLPVAESGWNAIQEVVRNEVKFKRKPIKGGFKIENNLPGTRANDIVSIRPHSNNRYYKFKNGDIIGTNPANGDELPDGQVMTKQSFWLNSPYVVKQLNPSLLEDL